MESAYMLVFVLGLLGVASTDFLINDLDHPCVRKCKTGQKPMTCEYDWTVESYLSMSRACYQCPFNEFDCHLPHCIPMAGYMRPVYSVNRRLPGPSIQVCENDVIVVKVRNRMQNEEGEGIHWHGLHMRNAQHMDGVPHITQCPISAGHDFTYKFEANLPGTHWWHSHAGNHRSDGLFGPIIIRQSEKDDINSDLYDKDDPSHVITIIEWTKAMSSTVDLSLFHAVQMSPCDGILINGKGTNHVVTRPDNTSASVGHHLMYVKKGLRYRFRVIGAAANVAAFIFSIDNHRLKVIAMDGAPVTPFDVDRITVFSGDRYDIVVTADQRPTNYWIRVAGLLDCFRHQEVGILRYAGTPKGTVPRADRTRRAEGSLLNPFDGNLSHDATFISELTDAEEKRDDLSHADVTHYLELNGVWRNGAKGLHHPVFYPYERASNTTYTDTPVTVINNISFAFPEVPLLSHWQDVKPSSWCNEDSLRKSGKNCMYVACDCIHRIDIKENQVVELVFINILDVLAHQMHLHGYTTEIIGMAKMYKYFTIEDFKRLDAEGKIKRNLKNAPRKDSFMVPQGGYLILRFRANNPGWWLLHCHVDYHLKLGMGMVIHVEGDMAPPPADMPKCTNF
ncbi:uncharacterized protein LOC129279112 [Lytechinus pictus]|uniref:uncharacterized protein LOC129279112 n=1 Tax=Lytechinus pictus TaxID=7653 RepID=UPI0030BA14BB